MNKRQAALAVALVLMLVAIWFATRFGYQALVTNRIHAQANAALEAVGNGYDQRMLALSELTFNHASWDEMYDFVQRGRGDAANRLAANAASIASYVLVFNDRGAVLYARVVSAAGTEEILEALGRAVRSSRILSHAGPDSAYAAPVMVSRKPLLVVSRPVLPSSRKGAIRGSVVVAADWDPVRDARSAAMPPVAVDVFDLRAQDLPADVRSMTLTLRSMRKGVGEIGDGRTGGYLLMDDISGEPAIMVRTAFTGGWTAETEQHVRYFAGILGVIGCIFLLVFVAIGRGDEPLRTAGATMPARRRRSGPDEAEAFCMAVAAKTRDGIFTIDQESRVISANENAAEYFNTSVDRVINKYLKDLVPPDTEKIWRTSVADAYRLGVSAHFEYSAKIKGERVPISIWLVPFKDKNGIVYKLVGVSRRMPLTQKTDAVAAPAAPPPPPPPPSPQEMLRLFDSSDQPFFAVDAGALSVAYCNDAAATLWGIAREDAIGKPIESIFPTDVASAWKKRMEAAAGTRATIYSEEYLQTGDRRTCHGIWMVPLTAPDGTALVAVMTHDITAIRGENQTTEQQREELAALQRDLERAREALSAERQRFLAAFDQINEIIFTVDAETLVLTYVNRFAAIQWGSDVNDLIGKSLGDVLPADRAESWRQHIKTAVDTGATTYAEENLGVGTTGLTVGCWIVPVKTLEGVWDTVLVLSHDVTDERRIAFELQRKEEEIRRLRKELSELPAPVCELPSNDIPVFSPALAAERLAPTFDEVDLPVFLVQASTGRLCYLNAAAAAQWNIASSGGSLDKTVEELLPAAAASLLRDNIGTVLAQGSPRYYEDAALHESGTRWFGTWLIPVRNQIGAIEKVMGLGMPVTELRTEEKTRDKNAEIDRILREPVPENLVSAEQELALEQRRLLSVFDSIDEIVYVVDPRTYELLYVNPTFRKVFGDNFIGRKCFEVFQGTEAPCAICAGGVDAGQKSSAATHTWECRNNLNQGWYHCLDGTMTWSDGRMVCYKIAFDITERRFLEEKLFQVHKQLQITFEQSVTALAETMKSRNVYTARHQQRVANLACAIAREMGFHSHVVDGIRMASLIHDIGYVSIPAEILDKRGQLTAREVSILKMHPQVGYNIIKTIPFPWPVAQMVLQHHERLDGTGYPLGLTAEDIIIEARIVGVADVIEAMANYRPYRPARGLEAALDEVSTHRGTYYDPDVVDACLALFRRKAFKF